MCGSISNVAHGGENDINRHKDTSKHMGYLDAAQQQRKLTSFGTSSATAKLNKKAVKVAFFWFSGWTKPPFKY